METSQFTKAINAKFKGAVLDSGPFGRSSHHAIWLEMKNLLSVAKYLKDGIDGFTFESLDNLGVMQVDRVLVLSYFLCTSRSSELLVLRVSLDPQGNEHSLVIPSVAEVWKSALFFEEYYGKLFGIQFDCSKKPDLLVEMGAKMKSGPLRRTLSC